MKVQGQAPIIGMQSYFFLPSYRIKLRTIMWGLLSPLRIHVYLFRTTEAETIY
jgi:hypothetical protein